MAKKWEKIGKPKTLFSKFGKFLRREFFINPKTGKREEFIFVGEANSVGVLALTKNRTVILNRQFKQASGKILVEVPAGVIDKGESLLAAVKRELEEETGYISNNIKQVGKFMRSTRSIPSMSYCFLALNCRKAENPNIDQKEGSEPVEMMLDEWLKDVKSGNVLDCLSIITTLLSLKYLKTWKIGD